MLKAIIDGCVQLQTKAGQNGQDWTKKVTKYLRKYQKLEGLAVSKKFGSKAVLVDIGTPFWQTAVNKL